MRVVANTSPLIALDRIGRVDLLRALFSIIIRPQSVLDELLVGKEAYGLSATLRGAPWIITEPDPPEVSLRKELGAGETAVIALALRSAADLVILDDLQARLVAQDLGLRVTGTLGVLWDAHRMGILPGLQEALNDLKAQGFRISPQLLDMLGA